MCAIPVMSAVLAYTETQEAYQIMLVCAMISDELGVLLDIWLTIRTSRVEKKPLLSLLSIKSSP